jgi:hypothetical protein
VRDSVEIGPAPGWAERAIAREWREEMTEERTDDVEGTPLSRFRAGAPAVRKT